ncbi:MAG: BMP family ABC transporter substrate-binding protein [Halanaerobiales bacterium]|nr:BMP family ABC transporter substrate-binding protein [Halanaerobiales bacterium]
MGFSTVGMAQDFKVGMVTDVGGLGDQSFNDSAWRGLKRAEEEFGIEINVIESNTMTDYVPNLSSFAEQGYDMVWAIGFLMTDALTEVSAMYPDVHFGLIDSVVEAPNVVNALFDEHEGSFLVGVVAGMRSETNKVGYIGGMEMPLIKKFEAGYRAGVKAVNPDAEVYVAYTGSFDDPQAGKELALTQFDQGADVIYHASGACGIGVIKAANEKGLYAIGVDSPQYHLAPANVLTSMIKRVDVAVYNEVKKLYEGNFEPGTHVYGLADNGVGIYREQAENMLSDEILNTVDNYKQKIIDGEITVPTHPDEL